MQELATSPKNALIIGGMRGIGREFAKLAAKDLEHLILIDEQELDLISLKKELHQKQVIDIYVNEENLAFPDSAENIYTDCLLYHHITGKKPTIDLLINVLEFRDESQDVDLWQEDAVSSHFNIATLMEINQFFFQDMMRTGKGQILNVIAKPSSMSEEMEDMFFQTQALLLEFSHDLNESASSDQIGIHTLCTSENSFVLQARIMPEHVAHDMMPPSCSAKEIAGYGYQVLSPERRSRGAA